MQTAWLLQMPDQSLVWLLIPSLASQQVDFPYCKPTVFRRVVLWGWVFWTAIKKRVIFFFNLSRKLRRCKLKPEPLRHEAPYFSEPPPCPTLESRVGAGHWAALRAAGPELGRGPRAFSRSARSPGSLGLRGGPRGVPVWTRKEVVSCLVAALVNAQAP